MIPEPTHYKAYILRVWQVERDGQPVWVASLEECSTNTVPASKRKVLPSLAALVGYLESSLPPADPSGHQSTSDNLENPRS